MPIRRPEGAAEWMLTVVVGVVVTLTLAIFLNPTSSLSAKEYVEILQWVGESIAEIVDQGAGV